MKNQASPNILKWKHGLVAAGVAGAIAITSACGSQSGTGTVSQEKVITRSKIFTEDSAGRGHEIWQHFGIVGTYIAKGKSANVTSHVVADCHPRIGYGQLVLNTLATTAIGVAGEADNVATAYVTTPEDCVQYTKTHPLADQAEAYLMHSPNHVEWNSYIGTVSTAAMLKDAAEGKGDYRANLYPNLP